MTLAGLIDEAKNHGEQIVRHWKLHEGHFANCSQSAGASSSGSTAHAKHGKDKESAASGIKGEIQEIRKIVQNTLAGGPSISGSGDSGLAPRVDALEQENKDMRSQLKDLNKTIQALQQELKNLKIGGSGGGDSAPAKAAPAPADDDDDEVDLFGSDSDEDDEEKEKIKQERLAAYAAKKTKKPGPIAKSNVILDIKPWDDETDLGALEKDVRTIEKDGMLWGASKLVPVAFGIKKLQICCVVEDEKVSIDELTEQIEGFEDYVQSVDIAAFQKI